MSRSLKVGLWMVLILLLLLVGATLGYFLVQNASWVVVRFPTVQVDRENPFPVVEYESPLAWVMAAAMLAGFVLGVLLFLPSWLRRVWERHRERRFITSLEGELTELRNLPVERPAPLEDLPDEKAPARMSEEEELDEDAALLAAALREADKPGPAGGANR
jgi:UPF0716 family protein affecting phage T7 exclusion